MATDFLSSVIEAYNTGARFNPEVMRQQALGNQFKLELQRLAVEEALQNQQDRLNPQAANMRALQAQLAGKVGDQLSGITFTEGGVADVGPTLPNPTDLLDPNVRPPATVANQVELLLGPGGLPTGFQFDANRQKQAAQRARSLEDLINPPKPIIPTSGPFAGMAIDPNTLQARDIVTAGGATLPEISRRDQERLLAIERDQTLSAEDRAFARLQELERIRQAGASDLERQRQTGRETLSDIARQKEKAAKPLTDAQSKDLFFATQMKKANLDLQALEDKKYDPTNLSAETLAPSYFPKILRTDEKKEYDTAIENFVQSVLRKETGAAIRNDEKAWVESRFVPIAGDPPNLVKAKKENRLLVAEIVTISSQGQKMTMDEIDEAIIRARQEAGIDRSKSPSQTPVTPSDIRKKFGF